MDRAPALLRPAHLALDRRRRPSVGATPWSSTGAEAGGVRPREVPSSSAILATRQFAGRSLRHLRRAGPPSPITARPEIRSGRLCDGRTASRPAQPAEGIRHGFVKREPPPAASSSRLPGRGGLGQETARCTASGRSWRLADARLRSVVSGSRTTPPRPTSQQRTRQVERRSGPLAARRPRPLRDCRYTLGSLGRQPDDKEGGMAIERRGACDLGRRPARRVGEVRPRQRRDHRTGSDVRVALRASRAARRARRS